MATLPGTPDSNAAPPDVDSLFPAQSVDELFPASVERERYRRQTLGTSPIQDMIFGNSEVNPVARVLDAFGQGAKHAWGAGHQEGLSVETEAALKINKQFDTWNEGQNGIVKAANEVLFRPAAVQLAREFRDAQAIAHGVAAGFAGVQGAVAKIGEETGFPKLGKELAAVPEAFMGSLHPTGIPPSPSKYPLSAHDLPKAMDLKVVGEGEAGYFGTKQPEAAPPISGAQEAAKPAGMPVDLFVERTEPRPIEAVKPREPEKYTITDPLGAAADGEKWNVEILRNDKGEIEGLYTDRGIVKVGPAYRDLPPEEAIAATLGDHPNGVVPDVSKVSKAAEPEPAPGIASDVAGKLIAAGRPEAEARASAQLIAAHYEARAERFKGERGSAEELYRAEGADIRSGDGKAPVRSEPLKPEGDATAVESSPRPTLDGGAAESIDTAPELKTALRGRAAADPQTWSLYEFLASEGGLKPTADLHSIFGNKRGPFVPGFGPLLRPDGLTLDEALTRAKEHSYILDPNDIQHVGQDATRKSGELTKSVNDLQDMIAGESHGRKNYRTDRAKPDAKINPEEERTSILDALHRDVETATGKKQHIDPAIEDRVVEIVQKEGGDVHSAFERAIMEDHDRHEGLLDARRSAHGEIAGHDNVGGPASRDGEELAGDRGQARATLEEERQANEFASRDHGEADRSSESLTAAQLWDRFAADRQARDHQMRIASGFNDHRTRSGQSEIRAGSSQVWEPGNVVDVGIVKNLLIVGKEGDGSFTLLLKPNDAGISRRYSFKQHEGISRDGEVDFKEATKALTDRELELNQIKRGKINLREDAKPVITLFKDANASTFIHETGHQWLEELMKDSEHPKAPADLKSDAIAVLDWLGVQTAEQIKTSHHEKFARGFERYMMEGKAPTQELAGVFQKFKEWLTRIYQTVTRLKSPINDEIRGVFDRLISLKKEDVKIEPEGPPKTFADIHETDALHTLPEAARPVAETIRAERDMLANEHIPEGHDARLENIASGTSRREAGGLQPLRDGNEAKLDTTEARNDQATGTVRAGGSDAAPEGNRASVGGGKTEPPVSQNASFTGSESALVDKAGNIRLDNLGTAEDVNKAIRDAAAENNDFIDARRGVVTDGQVLELADALGMDAGQLNQRKLGQAYNAEQIMAARKLLIQSATNVRDAMVRAAEGSEADIMAYAEAKSRHQMIQEQVSGITAEAGRALRAFRKLEGQQEAGQIDAFLKDATGKTLFQLQREAKLGSQLTTPAQVSKFVNDSAKPTWKEMVIEAWISALLSGPKTHIANIMGNSISGLWRPVETATSAVIGKARNLVTGSQDRVLFGEAASELFGMVQGSKEGVVAAYKAFKTEEPQLTSTRQIEQGHPKALPSATVNILGREMEIGGKQARIPLRLLGAEDEFFKAVAFRGDINRQAYAIAAKENLSAEKFNARVAELSMNPTEEMAAHAKEVADYQTFQTPLGKVGRSVQNFANSHMLAKFIIPFVRTPLNLLKYAGERTPLGLFAEEVRDNISGKNGAVARDTQIARITLGTMIGVATYELASQGLITGGGPADKGKKAIMQADGWQDYSVRIGDMYYRYNRLDPFSIILGLVADSYEIHKATGSQHLDKEHIPALIFAAISKNVLERASLRGPSDLIQAVADPDRFGKGYIKSMAGTVVPALSAQTAQTIDPVIREARTVLDGIKARIPGLSLGLHPKRDIWGEPMVREGGLGPDIASPIMEKRIKNDPVNQALLGANYFPGKLDRKIRGIELSDDQYDDYARIAGRMAKVRLNAIVGIPGFSTMPEVARKELMTNAITTSREAARSLIMMQNPEIIKKATDAKVAKQRGETVH